MALIALVLFNIAREEWAALKLINQEVVTSKLLIFIKLDGDEVAAFDEKPEFADDWINGGYFVIEPAFFENTHNIET